MSLESTKSTHPAFFAAVEASFPGSGLYERVLVSASAMLASRGFTKTSAIALVSQCRDELTRPLVACVDRIWGHSFTISSLAGMVFCGRTGFLAAMHHSPQDADGYERYVFFVGPHIAISADGVVGEVMRPGRTGASGACGSLQAFRGELVSGGEVDLSDPLDAEQAMVKTACLGCLAASARGDAAPSLVELTKIAHDAIVTQVKETVASTERAGHKSHVAIVSGVLIHGPDGADYFWPGGFEINCADVLADFNAACVAKTYDGVLAGYAMAKGAPEQV